MSTFATPVDDLAKGWSKIAAIATTVSMLGILAASSAAAQSWPQRNVRFILPFGAGSATDAAARMIGERVSVRWGRPVIVENRPGGDSLIAINAFVSANDDHVLLYASSATFLAHPYTQEKLSYDLERDLAPIARLTDTIVLVAVPASGPNKTLAEFVNAARNMPAKHNAAAASGLAEFTLDAFLKSEKLDARKIPYKDFVLAAPDLVEGRIQLLITSVPPVRAHAEAGKVRILATTNSRRSPHFSDIPTVAEAGYPGLTMQTTAGLYGPKSMPLELRRRIGAEVVAVLGDPAIAAKIAATGQDIRTGGPEELAETLRQQAVTTAAVAKILGMPKL